MTQKFDAIIIGAGQAGPSLAARLAASGMTVAIVERHLFGGTCVNTGCMPTKALVASAYAAHLARRAAFYGVHIEGEVGIDMARVKARVDGLSTHGRAQIEANLTNTPGCSVFRGHARFEGPHQVSVAATASAVAGAGELRLVADKIFINVGGRARVPELPGIEQVNYLTNTSMLQLESVPRHLIIVGGSYIGLEFAQMYRRFGAEVTVLEMGQQLISREDPEVALAVQNILEAEGIAVRLGAECIRFEQCGAEIDCGLNCTTGAPHITGSHVLLAVGRRPNTDSLNLPAAGIAADDKGYIIVDDELATSVPGVWALGDCNGQGAFTHTAYNDYEIVAANLLDNDKRRVSDRITAYALYSDPPLGRVGLTEKQVRQSGRPALVGVRAMSQVGRAIEKGETQGFMKILVDAETQKIVGASILGTGGDEAIHCILDIMYAKVPYSTLQRAVHIHPTVSELIPTVLGNLAPLH